MDFDTFLTESVVRNAFKEKYGSDQGHFHSKKVKEGTDASKGHTGHLSAWHDKDEDEWHVNHVTLDSKHKIVKHDPMPRETFSTKHEAIAHINKQS